MLHRNTLEVIRSSTEEHGKHCTDDIHSGVRIESRYKLIIDPSEDESLVRLLFSYSILPEGETRTYICSDFPSDQHSEVCFLSTGNDRRFNITNVQSIFLTSKLKILQIIMWNIGMAKKAKETRSGCLVHIVQ